MLNDDLQVEMHGMVERLKRAHEELDFIVLVLPYHVQQIAHLGTEHRQTLEKRMAHAAADAFSTYMEEDHVPTPRV